MKRYFGIGAALAGILALGLAACTDGNGDFAPEIPTTYGEADAGYSGSGITATWDFSGLPSANNVWGLTSTEAPIADAGLDGNGSLKLADGTSAQGAVLRPFGSWKENTNVIQGKRDSVTISTVSPGTRKNAPGFELTLEKQANIVIVARGAGSAEATRFVAIFDKDGKTLAYKENLASGAENNVTFTVKGATPESSPYTIFANGASICSIDLSVSSADLEKPSEITELMIDKSQADIDENPFEVYETLQFNVSNVYTDGDDKEIEEDMTKDAVWTSSNTAVATVNEGLVTGVGEGEAVIRARIGRFYTERTVTVTPSTKTRITFIGSDKLPATDKIYMIKGDDTGKTVEGFLALDEMKPLLKPTVIGGFATANDATLSFNKQQFAFLTGDNAKVGILKKGEANAADGTFGLYWRSADYNPAPSKDSSIEEATFTFKVTPNGKPVKLKSLTALTLSNKGSSSHKLVVTIDDKVSFEGGLCKPTANTEISLNDYVITSETEVKVKFVVLTNGTRTAIQDLTLVVTE